MHRFVAIACLAGFALAGLIGFQPGPSLVAQDRLADEFTTTVRPLLTTHCLNCHSTKAKKGDLDLERFAKLDDLRKDTKPWQAMIEQIESGEMPPKEKPQPTDAEKKKLVQWIRRFLDAEAKARVGDPGRVPLRRLSNAEYDATIRDLTGVDLRPTREFPADGAAGEGFTNAAEALTDISPALFMKYMNAAREIAEHAVLLPDGLRFSPSKTRRDWSDEGVQRLRNFYSRHVGHVGPDGKLDFTPYVLATIRHRARLNKGQVSDVAAQEKLNAKYLGLLWTRLSGDAETQPLAGIQKRWKAASETDGPSLAAEIASWQNVLWQTARVGNYFRPQGTGYTENLSRQFPAEPKAVETHPFRLAVKPLPGQAEVVLRLSAQDLLVSPSTSRIIWKRPRLESAGKPSLALVDYPKYGSSFELDFQGIFADTEKYLTAVAAAAKNPKLPLDTIATERGLNVELLKRWIDFIELDLTGSQTSKGRTVPFVELKRLDTKAERIDGKPWIRGWHSRTAGLPIVMSNSSDTVEHIPGRAGAHSVVVHPTPQEFVGIVWTSPIAGTVNISGKVAHAHPNCGNGVAWWVEHRRDQRAKEIAAGTVDLGKDASIPVSTMTLQVGDQLMLVVDARDANHVCDLTDVGFEIRETAKPERVWNLTSDVADTIHDGNPHADKHGHSTVWSFVKGPTRAVSGTLPIPPGSILGQWKSKAAEVKSDAKRARDMDQLAGELRKLLTGPRPVSATDPNRILYDHLAAVDGPLLKGLDAKSLRKHSTEPNTYGRPATDFDADGNLLTQSNAVTEIRLPAALIVGREFVVEGMLSPPIGDRAVALQVTSESRSTPRWDGQSPLLASGDGLAKLRQGFDSFRELFPIYLCYPNVIPTDEVVSLKMFHREDEPLARLFLNEQQFRELDHIWAEHRFVSKQAILENDYLPQFIGFVTQDQPKGMVSYFEGQRAAFKRRADEAIAIENNAVAKQLEAVLRLAANAYRRPLQSHEAQELRKLYHQILAKGTTPEEAIRGVIQRILVAPAFLFRIESAPPGKEPKRVSDWELATRLSYFLWSSMPDEELRSLAAAGQLHDAKTLEGQARRMLADPRTRSLAIEFGTQWIHVRGFDQHNEKNERLFPTLNAELKSAIYEESIRFFQDLFQADRPITDLLDSDATYLNELLAKHYGIPNVSGPEWRRVEGVKRYGRGGLLGLASVQAKESGASRTSPVLRGNWVVETLLGEKLPKPPANVPKLPEEETAETLTVRQLTERHVADPACAVCHVRIDPFGFAFEQYDPIGRRREKDLAGRPIDARAKLRDGTEFEGIDGLRAYLVAKKRDVITRLFCQRLLGYALGRSVTLSDTTLIDAMVEELKKNDGRIFAAVRVIILSPQFQMIRGANFED